MVTIREEDMVIHKNINCSLAWNMGKEKSTVSILIQEENTRVKEILTKVLRCYCNYLPFFFVGIIKDAKTSSSSENDN